MRHRLEKNNIGFFTCFFGQIKLNMLLFFPNGEGRRLEKNDIGSIFFHAIFASFIFV